MQLMTSRMMRMKSAYTCDSGGAASPPAYENHADRLMNICGLQSFRDQTATLYKHQLEAHMCMQQPAGTQAAPLMPSAGAETVLLSNCASLLCLRATMSKSDTRRCVAWLVSPVMCGARFVSAASVLVCMYTSCSTPRKLGVAEGASRAGTERQAGLRFACSGASPWRHAIGPERSDSTGFCI